MSAGRRAPGSPVSPLLHARLPLTALLLAVCGCVLVFAGLSELPPLLLLAAEAATQPPGVVRKDPARPVVEGRGRSALACCRAASLMAPRTLHMRFSSDHPGAGPSAPAGWDPRLELEAMARAQWRVPIGFHGSCPCPMGVPTGQPR
jgi:hypothetical protein